MNSLILLIIGNVFAYSGVIGCFYNAKKDKEFFSIKSHLYSTVPSLIGLYIMIFCLYLKLSNS